MAYLFKCRPKCFRIIWDKYEDFYATKSHSKQALTIEMFNTLKGQNPLDFIEFFCLPVGKPFIERVIKHYKSLFTSTPKLSLIKDVKTFHKATSNVWNQLKIILCLTAIHELNITDKNDRILLDIKEFDFDPKLKNSHNLSRTKGLN